MTDEQGLMVQGKTVRCGTCLWWDESQGDMKTLGECRRRAPASQSVLDLLLCNGAAEVAQQIDDGPWGHWPWTKDFWWCGDHVPRNPATPSNTEAGDG